MKKLTLFLLLFPILSIAQVSTGQEQEFDAGIKNNSTQTVLNAQYLVTQGSDGTYGKILPGNLTQTTAGVTQRVYFTADNTTVNSVVYFASSVTSKGSTATGSPPALVLGDNTKSFFTKDIISVAQPSNTIGYQGTYSGNLTVSATPTPNATQQRFTVEIYRTNNLGIPIASGVSGAPTGDLGVTVLAILDSGIINLTAGSITNIPISGILTQNVTINTGERLRYHVSAAKIGAGGGSVTFGVYYGNAYNSYYDVPVAITTGAVLNESAVIGITNTDALNSLNTLKANDSGVIHTAGDETKSGSLTLSSTNAVSGLQDFKMESIDYGGGGVRNNFILRSLLGTTGQNIRIQVDDFSAHVGINKGNTSNSAIAMLADPSNNAGGMEFRGVDFQNGTDTNQATFFQQDINDFNIRTKSTSGVIYFKHSGNVVKNVAIYNNGRVGIGGVSLTTNPLARFHVDSGDIAIGGSAMGGIRFFNTASAERSSILYTGTGLEINNSSGNPTTIKNSGTTALSISSAGIFTLPVSPSFASTSTSYDAVLRNSSTGVLNKITVPLTYTALITQSSTSAPTVTVLGTNTIGTIVWTRSVTGTYIGTLSGVFTANKTMCFVNNTVPGSITFKQTSTNTIEITTSDLTGSLLDSRLTSNSIKIEVYP